MRGKWLFLAPLAVTAMAAFVAIGTVAVLLLWNWLLPQLFGWPAITFWQALGLLVLCRILFGAFGGPGWMGSSMGSEMRRRMADRMAARWEAMTPEERERFRQGMRGRCGSGPAEEQASRPESPHHQA